MKIRITWFDDDNEMQSCILTVKILYVCKFGLTMVFDETFSLHAYWEELEYGFDLMNF